MNPKEKADLHRKIPKGLNLDRILCIKAERVLRNDFTIARNKKLYQIQDNIKTEKVIVEERINGTMAITHNNTFLKFKEITERPEKQKKRILKKKTFNKPPLDHPWRKLTDKRWKNNSWRWAA